MARHRTGVQLIAAENKVVKSKQGAGSSQLDCFSSLFKKMQNKRNTSRQHAVSTLKTQFAALHQALSISREVQADSYMALGPRLVQLRLLVLFGSHENRLKLFLGPSALLAWMELFCSCSFCVS